MQERYDIRSKIAQGGVGAVYLAWDRELEREVAIKRLLPPDVSELEEAPEAILQKEAGALSSLQHPNIVTVFDVGTDDDGSFVIMEYIDGQTIEEVVAESAMTEEDLIHMAGECLEGLTAAGAVGLLHRDVKPSNIMVQWLPSGKFQTKLLDFGLAKFSPKPTLQTIDNSRNILGSIYFIAPEQFERQPLDQRTDLYALGCVLYNALTQKYPFDGDSAAAVMSAHLEHRFVPITEERPDLSPGLVAWLERMMSREVGDRPADARAALRELEAVVANPKAVPAAAASAVAPPADTPAPTPSATTPDPAPAPSTPAASSPSGNQTKRLITGLAATKATSQNKVATGNSPTAGSGPVATTPTGKAAIIAAELEEEEKRRRRLILLVGGGLLLLGLIVLLAVLLGGKDDPANISDSGSSVIRVPGAEAEVEEDRKPGKPRRTWEEKRWVNQKGLIPPAEMKMVSVSSELIHDGHFGTNAIDGNQSTFWHTRWAKKNPHKHPHEIIIDLGRIRPVTGFSYLTRRDGWNGTFKETEFYLSEDPDQFPETPHLTHTFKKDRAPQQARLPEVVPGRYLRIRILSEVNGEIWASAAEIGALVK